MSTAYRRYIPTPEDEAALGELLFALVHHEVKVEDDLTFTPVPCGRCGEPGRLTVVRVYCDPRPDADGPSGPEEACCFCAPVLIAEAIGDKSDKAGPIVVEVAA